jgi:uncharacterized protein YqgV (UPF0045/DUF77 family)
MSDYITLADGTLVYKDGKIVPVTPTVVEVEEQCEEEEDVSTSLNPSRLVIPVKKKLRDLPESTRTMNGISAVLCYSLFGLNDDDIAEAIGTTIERIANIRALPSYVTMRNDVITNVISAEQNDVRELFVKHSRKAVNTVVEGMDAKRTSDRLKAASDILDRSGFRPADVVEHRHRLEGGLTIEVVRKDSVLPVIDMALMED